MSGKIWYVAELTWVTSNPVPYVPNAPGTSQGSLSGTNTIWTNIVPTPLEDNFGIELTWTGNPTGNIDVYCSNSGLYFYDLTLVNPIIGPIGASGGSLVNLIQLPFKYFMLQYTNVSGAGNIMAYLCAKDLN